MLCVSASDVDRLPDAVQLDVACRVSRTSAEVLSASSRLARHGSTARHSGVVRRRR